MQDKHVFDLVMGKLTILLYIHGEQANIHTFNLLKQENGLYKTQKLVQDSYNYLLDIEKWDIG